MKEENKQTEKLKDDLDIFSERLIKSMNGEKGVSETGKMLARYYSAVSTLNNFSSKNISFLLNQVDNRNMNIALYNQDGKGMILNKVKSYKNWQSDGVQVEKGQKSLQVYAPVQQYKIKHDEDNKPIKKGKYWDYEKDENGNKIKSGVKFIKVPVFNSDQTNAEELGLVKKIDFTNNRGDISSELLESFISEVSNKFDIPIKQDILSPNLGGFYVPSTHTITLNEARNNKDKLNILFHEVGHSILHKGEESQKISKGIKEAEAESVSFILSSKLGIQSKDSSIYIKEYGNDVKVVKDRLERITQASKDVFKKIDFDELIEREENRLSQENNNISTDTQSKIKELIILAHNNLFDESIKNSSSDLIVYKNGDIELGNISDIKDKENILYADYINLESVLEDWHNGTYNESKVDELSKYYSQEISNKLSSQEKQSSIKQEMEELEGKIEEVNPLKDINDEDRKNLDSLNQQLKDLDKSYYKDEISNEDYESSKQDLYIEIYKLEKLLGETEQEKQVDLSEYQTKTFDTVDDMVEQFKKDNQDIIIDTVHKNKLLDNYDESMKLSKSSTTSSEILDTLSQHDNYLIRKEVAQNPNTSTQTLEVLSNDKNLYVKESATENPNSNFTSKIWVKDMISRETEDYQNRGGSYPKHSVPVSINTNSNKNNDGFEMEFSFKSTSEDVAKRWVDRKFIPQIESHNENDNLNISVNTYQDGDYDDDWVSVIVKVQDLSHSQEHIKIEEPTEDDEDDFDFEIKPIDKKSLEINFEDDTSKQAEDSNYSQEQ